MAYISDLFWNDMIQLVYKESSSYPGSSGLFKQGLFYWLTRFIFDTRMQINIFLLQSTAIAVRFLTRRFIGEYEPNMGKKFLHFRNIAKKYSVKILTDGHRHNEFHSDG